MENLHKILETIQKDLAQQREEIRNVEHNITKKISEKIDEKFNTIESRTLNLEKQIQQQQKCIENLERQVKIKNVVFFGIEETERSYGNLQINILKIINSDMGINCQKTEIENVWRLGKKSDRPRPVIVTFTTVGRKIEILKNNKSLRGTNLYVKADYTQSVLQKRKELQQELKNKLKQGEKVILRYDKIISLERKEVSPKKIQKRGLSESPKIVGQSNKTESINEKKIYHSSKKNKMYNISSYMNTPNKEINDSE